MPSTKLPEVTAWDYEQAAQAYLRSLPPEHFMEATPQATQRKITLESFDLIHARRPAVQVFNELLVQYPRPHGRPLGQVVPDNMIVVHAVAIQAKNSFDISLQPARPLMVLEYVSRHSQRKDYEDNLVKYERELKVPYCLRFYPDNQELTLFHRNKRKYITVKPNAQARLPIAELDLEVALLDGWMRYWYRGELLPLPADLQRALDEVRQRLAATQSRLDATQSRLDATQSQFDAERQARQAVEEELARLRAQSPPSRRPRSS
jgi:Uma2 family endonuclease